jgi:hypothetical protein
MAQHGHWREIILISEKLIRLRLYVWFLHDTRYHIVIRWLRMFVLLDSCYVIIIVISNFSRHPLKPILLRPVRWLSYVLSLYISMTSTKSKIWRNFAKYAHYILIHVPCIFCYFILWTTNAQVIHKLSQSCPFFKLSIWYMVSIIVSDCSLVAVYIYCHVTFQYFAYSNCILYNSSFRFCFLQYKIWFLGLFCIWLQLFWCSCFVRYFRWFWCWSILASVAWFYVFC